LNRIKDVIGQPDLADRAIFLTLAPMAQEQRRSETTIAPTVRSRWPSTRRISSQYVRQIGYVKLNALEPFNVPPRSRS
jgi:hypothetical protein